VNHRNNLKGKRGYASKSRGENSIEKTQFGRSKYPKTAKIIVVKSSSIVLRMSYKRLADFSCKLGSPRNKKKKFETLSSFIAKNNLNTDCNLLIKSK